MRENVEVLEHHADLLAVVIDVDLFVGDVHAFKDNLAAGRLFQQVQTPQKRRLAAAGRADDRNDLTLMNCFVDSF